MNVCERMNRERIALADLDDDEAAHVLDNRAKVRRFTRALRSEAAIPPLFVIRQGGKLTLIQGCEQTAAADRLGVDELDGIVWDAADDAEADEIGAIGFGLAESGCDVWSGLQLMARAAA